MAENENECEYGARGQYKTEDGSVNYVPNDGSIPFQDAFCAAKLLLSIRTIHICNETRKEECWVYQKFSKSIDIKPGARGALVASKRVAPTS